MFDEDPEMELFSLRMKARHQLHETKTGTITFKMWLQKYSPQTKWHDKFYRIEIKY